MCVAHTSVALIVAVAGVMYDWIVRKSSKIFNFSGTNKVKDTCFKLERVEMIALVD